MKRFSRRAFLFGGGAAVGLLAANRYRADLPTLTGTNKVPGPVGGTLLNDASELNPTPVFKHTRLNTGLGQATIDAVRAEIKAAQNEGRAFNIGAARHSMGGQAIPRDGRAITFDSDAVELDQANGVYKVHAGARWSQVIAALDLEGFSPKVMQSNNDFGVAATFSVNAHGWPAPLGPMGATVREVEMVLPSGEHVTASRRKNSDLFRHAMGGYGLIGAITSLTVEMAKNKRLTPTFEEFEAKNFGTEFMDALADPAVNMAYGRLNVDRGNFFDQALLITYRAAEDQTDIPAATGSEATSHIASRLYRSQLGNERMKRFRWWVESEVGPMIGGDATRNSLINEPVITLDDRNPNRVDILHEYFVSPDRFHEFLEVCRRVIPASFQEFLNVTLRFVDRDPDSILAYAPVPRIAAVMSFSQELTARAETDMARMTRELVDGIIGIGGAYYLPYRQHPTVDQFTGCYSGAGQFAATKRALDPDLTFRNNLWDQYIEKV